MPFQITKFGSTTLPVYEGSDDLSATPARQALFDLPGGGVYDSYGSEQAPGGRLTLRVRRQIIGSSAADFRTQANTLRGLIGKRDQLWREWDDGTLEWVYARLVDLQGERTPGHVLDQEFELLFAVESVAWNAETETSTTGTINVPGETLVVTNGGNATVKNAVVTLTNPGGGSLNVTSLTLTVSGEVEWDYNGTLTPGDAVVIDTGARSVKFNGADDYANFSLGGNHAISEWLRLAPGDTTLTVNHAGVAGSLSAGALTGILGPPTYSGTVTVSVGALDIQVDFYEQWR